MIHLALQSEYTFQRCYGRLEQIVNLSKERDEWALGLADKNNTFGHVKFNKLCKSADIKPIFGVRLDATDIRKDSRSKYETCNNIIELTLIAKNINGLEKIYRLINIAYDQYYYFPRILFSQAAALPSDVLIIAPYLPASDPALAARIDYLDANSKCLKNNADKPLIACIKNEYISLPDADLYELLSAPNNTERHTYYQHIITEQELLIEGISQESINKTEEIAQICNVELNRSEMVKFPSKMDLLEECKKGAILKNIDLNDTIIKERLEKEINTIQEKDFQDYFFIVADILNHAKKSMLVGPGRGSSGGSLVCYLLGITEINPLKYDLLFERFVDINRSNLPDIDTDIPDIKRLNVINYISKTYGNDNVKSIGTVSTFKPKSAIGEMAKKMKIDAYETEEIKDAIIERRFGDERANKCIEDTFRDTNAGIEFIKKYPEMECVSDLEGHARHAGKHAAGIIVANEPLYKYGGIDSKESILMMDHRECESLGLLKIDVLGLRTLSILQETARLAKFNFKDFYSLQFNDNKVFDIFNAGRLSGIFQFEGKTLNSLTKQMGVNSFYDLCVITSLGRPGALNSGGAERYIKCKLDKEKPIYYGKAHEEITKSTYGIVIFQEQAMMIFREFANFNWEKINILRKAISKSYGDEYLSQYKKEFITGGKENGYTETNAILIWDAIASMAQYAFNKSHAVAYSMISYWTAWCKAYYPLEFAAANLNNSKDDQSSIHILRDFVINDNIEYIPINSDESDALWSIRNGKLLGGLTNIDGIGLGTARKIIKKRRNVKRIVNIKKESLNKIIKKIGIKNYNKRVSKIMNDNKYPPSIIKKLENPKTPFDILFPTEHYWGFLYNAWDKYNIKLQPSKIIDVQEPGEYIILGKIIEKELKDRNDTKYVLKRGYEVEKDRYFLNLYIEDDTDMIKCVIPPYAFEKMGGINLAKTIIEEKTWCLINGKIRDQWRSITIFGISDLERVFNRKVS